LSNTFLKVTLATRHHKKVIAAMSDFATPLVADQLALELLNSTPMEQGRSVDYLSTDALAAQWIARATDQPLTGDVSIPSGLARQARDLRQTIRELVEARKAGRRPSLDPLNAWLAQMPSHLVLVQQKDGPVLQRTYEGRAAARWLAAFGEAAAELMVDGNFELIRQCEHPECVLWFYDRTKAHKRRWCSMASCGNRHKVEQFRKRKQA
jgi:predicted RNA-binding Zn ribbon-like protein